MPEAGYDFRGITISGFQRKLSLENIKKNLKTVKRLFTSSAESKRILRGFQPDVCLGTGGYVSGRFCAQPPKWAFPSSSTSKTPSPA